MDQATNNFSVQHLNITVVKGDTQTNLCISKYTLLSKGPNELTNVDIAYGDQLGP